MLSVETGRERLGLKLCEATIQADRMHAPRWHKPGKSPKKVSRAGRVSHDLYVSMSNKVICGSLDVVNVEASAFSSLPGFRGGTNICGLFNDVPARGHSICLSSDGVLLEDNHIRGLQTAYLKR